MKNDVLWQSVESYDGIHTMGSTWHLCGAACGNAPVLASHRSRLHWCATQWQPTSLQNANTMSTNHAYNFRETDSRYSVKSLDFYFNSSSSNAFRTCSAGFGNCPNPERNRWSSSGQHPNPNPNLAFGPVRFGFGPLFRTELSLHYLQVEVVKLDV